MYVSLLQAVVCPKKSPIIPPAFIFVDRMFVDQTKPPISASSAQHVKVQNRWAFLNVQGSLVASPPPVSSGSFLLSFEFLFRFPVP